MADRIEADIERIEDLEANMVSRVWIPKQSAYASDTRRHKHKFADGTIRGYSADEEDAIIYGRREFRKTTSQVRIAYSDSVGVDLTCDSAGTLAIGDAVKINEHGMHIGATAADATTKVVVDGAAKFTDASADGTFPLSLEGGDATTTDAKSVAIKITARAASSKNAVGKFMVAHTVDGTNKRAVAVISTSDTSGSLTNKMTIKEDGAHLARSLVVGNFDDDPGAGGLAVDGAHINKTWATVPATYDNVVVDVTGLYRIINVLGGASTNPLDHSWGLAGGVEGQEVVITVTLISELINGIGGTQTIQFPGAYTKWTASLGCTIRLAYTSSTWYVLDQVGGTFS